MNDSIDMVFSSFVIIAATVWLLWFSTRPPKSK
jgi:hypothetical protein